MEKQIKQYQKNEQKDYIYKDTKLIIKKKKVQILYNKEMSPNKLAQTQQTKFRTCKSKN
jgi:hypothetical protein